MGKNKKEEARIAVEETRSAFHLLLNDLENTALKTSSVVTKRTILGVLAHLVIATEKAYPMLVKKAREGKPMPAFFGTKLGHYFSYKYSENKGKKLKNIDGIRNTYDTAHHNVLEVLNTIEEQEWELKTTLPKPSSRPLTIYEVFICQIPNHFAVHEEEIRKTIKK